MYRLQLLNDNKLGCYLCYLFLSLTLFWHMFPINMHVHVSSSLVDSFFPSFRRRKFVRESEKRYWEFVTPSCMTEESDTESGEKILTHQLLWRSECKLDWTHVEYFVCW